MTVGSECVFGDSNILPHSSSGTDMCVADQYRRLAVSSRASSKRRIPKRTPVVWPPNASRTTSPLKMRHAAEHTTHASTIPTSYPPILYSQRSLVAQTSMLGSDPLPHVLGSQGPEGILPSSPDRTTAPAAGAIQTKDQISQEDTDGKLPCPRCTKTYSSKKGLDRHVLERKSLPLPSTGRDLTISCRHR